MTDFSGLAHLGLLVRQICIIHMYQIYHRYKLLAYTGFPCFISSLQNENTFTMFSIQKAIRGGLNQLSTLFLHCNSKTLHYS